MGRVRASFGFVIGFVAVLAGLAMRASALRVGTEVVWAALALCLAAVLSSWVSRPHRDFLLDLGLLPLAGVTGVLLPLFALMEPTLATSFAPAGLECAGGFAALVAAIRFVRAQAIQSLPRVALSSKRKVKLRRENVKKLPEVPVASLVKGDVIEVSTGQDIPVDGRVEEGSGFVAESLVFGPGLPTAKKPGDVLFAGTHASIPDLAVTVSAPSDDAFVVRRQRLTDRIADDLASASRSGKIAGAIVATLALAGCVWVMVTRDLAQLEAWLPVLPAILLASVVAAPSLALMRGRLAVLDRASEHGFAFSRAKDVLALAKVRRWQIDPSVLAAPGEAEAIAFADASPDGLLQIAFALFEAQPGPERITLQNAVTKKKLPTLRGAALKREGGMLRGTIDGKRWFLGPEQVVAEAQEVELDATLEGPLDFLRDKDFLVYLIGNAEDGLLGAVGVGLGADVNARAAAEALDASVMPGLPDGTRRALAEAARIARDGPPLSRRDATLLGAESDPPSTGLRVRVHAVDPLMTLPDAASPKLFRSSLPYVGEVQRVAKKLHRVARARALLVTVVPVLVATALAYTGYAGGAVGSLIGLVAVVIAASRAGGRVEERAEEDHPS